MTLRPNTTLNESPVPSWADVIKQSECASVPEVQSASSTAAEDSNAPTIGPGDMLTHPKFGTCMVHRISEGVIHMARDNGPVVRLRHDMLTIRSLGVETLGNNKSRRVFTTSTEQL